MHKNSTADLRIQEPERRLASVMFADIVDSASVTSRFDPEISMGVLDRGIELMSSTVRAFGGTVARVEGDGLMAIFGAPSAHHDGPARACASAMEILRKFEFAKPNPQNPDTPLRVRVGIATGHIIVRTIENDFGRNYDAMGHPAHLAARLEKSAEPGTVLCDETTAELAGDHFQLQSVSIEYPGNSSPKPSAFRLVRASERIDRSPGLSNLQLFGREYEFGEALGAFENSLSGEVMHVISGPAGAGKTHLAKSVLSELASNTGATVLVSGDQLGAISPFRSLQSLVQELIGLSDSTCRSSSAFLAWHQRMRPGIPEIVRQGVHKILFSDANGELSQTAIGIDQSLLQDELSLAVGQLLMDANAHVFLDDAQWVDTPTLKVLDGLARVFERPPKKLLLATRDPQALEKLGIHATETKLGSLSENAVRKWLRFELEPGSFDEDQLMALANGFGMSAIAIRQILDTMHAADGQFRLASAQSGDTLTKSFADPTTPPPTLELLIGERIDSVSSGAYRLLQHAAVIGDEGELAQLADLSAEHDIDWDASIDELSRARLLSANLQKTAAKFQFAHSVLRNVAYDRITRAVRGQLHSRLFEILTNETGRNQPEDPAIIAAHAQRGERYQDAAIWYTKASTIAGNRGAYIEASKLVEFVSESIDLVEDEKSRLALTIKIAPVAGAAFMNLGQQDLVRKWIADAAAAADTLGDPVAEAQVQSFRATGAWKAGRHHDCVKDSLSVIATARRLGIAPLRVHGAVRFIIATHDLGQYDLCIEVSKGTLHELADGAVRDLQTFGDAYQIAAAFAARSHLETGNFDEAERLMCEAGAAHHAALRNFGNAGLQIAYGQFLHRTGDDIAARSIVQGARDWCVDAGISNLRGITTAWLATTNLYLGDAETASELLSEDSTLSQPKVSGIYASFYFNLALGLSRAFDNDHGPAEKSILQGIELARKHRESGHLARGYLCRGMVGIWLPKPKLEQGIEDLLQSRRLAQQNRMLPTLRDVALCLAVGCRRFGDNPAVERWIMEANRSAEIMQSDQFEPINMAIVDELSQGGFRRMLPQVAI